MKPSSSRIGVALWLFACMTNIGRGDEFIIAPHEGPTATGTIYPFLIKQIDYSPTAPKPTMRYQQVYNNSLFTNVDRSLIYATSLSFLPNLTEKPFLGWIVPQMQINFLTTTNAADTL